MRFVCVRCSCIDEWFKVSRSCPEHPGDWASVSSAATVHRSWIAGFFLELCSRWPAGCVLTGVSSAACGAQKGREGWCGRPTERLCCCMCHVNRWMMMTPSPSLHGIMLFSVTQCLYVCECHHHSAQLCQRPRRRCRQPADTAFYLMHNSQRLLLTERLVV